MHEALNFAALKKLPIVFVCENNGYAVYTNLQQRQPMREIHAVAEAHGVSAFVGDGNDVTQVSTIAQYAITQAREFQGPQFLEFHTHRWREHCGPYFDDDLGYREDGELDYWLQRCPILLAKHMLLENNMLNENDILILEKYIEEELKAAFEFALQSEMPTLGEIGVPIYAA